MKQRIIIPINLVELIHERGESLGFGSYKL
ncbi:hypothetical protein CLCHR_13220 [Clostridium chromiireducens]|uniref:Uncharacterized protein n=1 Tax=Clostridium chromiireducens TaxID=225345 RepID=A0A1V4IVI3_9CLOT|nr:hypothetical protein CLCHR_13220 [Clostridium chromiireducens]